MSGRTGDPRMVTNLTHGATRGGKVSPEWSSWRAMRQRCHDPNATGFDNYGARGIAVCDRWYNDFAAFLADMGPRPSPDHSLDRIDNDGPYEPGNCRWATTAEQNQKKRSLVMLTVDGETAYLAEWARRTGLLQCTIALRIKRGWPVDKAVKTPAGAIRGKGRPPKKKAEATS